MLIDRFDVDRAFTVVDDLDLAIIVEHVVEDQDSKAISYAPEGVQLMVNRVEVDRTLDVAVLHLIEKGADYTAGRPGGE